MIMKFGLGGWSLFTYCVFQGKKNPTLFPMETSLWNLVTLSEHSMNVNFVILDCFLAGVDN